MDARAHAAGEPEATLATGRRPHDALALAVPFWAETQIARPRGDGDVSGYAIAVGT